MDIESQTDLEFDDVEQKLTGAQRADLEAFNAMFADLEADTEAVQIVAQFADEAWQPDTIFPPAADQASLDRALADFDLYADDESLDAFGFNHPLEEIQPVVVPEALQMRIEANHREHQAKLTETAEAWRAIDTHRATDGKPEYLAKKRGKHAGKVMTEEHRRPRSYGVPDGPTKQAERKNQNRDAQAAHRDKMTAEERTAAKEKNSKARQLKREAVKKSLRDETAKMMAARNIV